MSTEKSDKTMNQLIGICIFSGFLGLMSIVAAGDGKLSFASLGTALLIISGLAFFTRLILAAIIEKSS